MNNLGKINDKLTELIAFFFLKYASDKKPEISDEREIKNLGPQQHTENCQILVCLVVEVSLEMSYNT